MVPAESDADGRGKVTEVFLAPVREQPVVPVASARALEGRGLEGCRHANKTPGGKRQVLLMDAANLRALAVEPGRMKENLVIEGLPLESLPPGQRLRVGEAVIELTEPCAPCHKMERIRPGFLKECWGRRGVLGKVILGGQISRGDEVVVLDVNPDAPKVTRPKLP